MEVHKARPGEDEFYCAVCMGRIRKVPGGNGPTYIHSDSGAVAAPGADHGMSDEELLKLWGSPDADSLPADVREKVLAVIRKHWASKLFDTSTGPFEPYLVCRYCGHESKFHNEDVCEKCIEIGDVDHADHAMVSDGGWTYPLCPECGRPTRSAFNGIVDDATKIAQVCQKGHVIDSEGNLV